MQLISKYLKQVDFHSYEDFYDNFSLTVPENFNFAFDVVDYWAASEPGKLALVYESAEGEEISFTFAEISRLSSQAANYFASKGIQKGDVVMLTLKHSYYFWIMAVGLHKLGAICVPATEQLKQKDYEYRFSVARVKMIATVEGEHLAEIEEAEKNSSRPIAKAFVSESERDGWDNIAVELAKMPDAFDKPIDYPCSNDLMLMYFTSGTTGNPKIVAHNYNYALGHITTAYYWSACKDNALHFSVSETGWAKCAWSKIYGQWLCGAPVLVYSYDRFEPEKMLDIMEKYPIYGFCAPPTIYRFLLRCDLSNRSLSHIKHCTTAGEALNAEVFHQWQEKTGLTIREGFGQSESAIIAGTFIWMQPRPGSLGKPNPLYKVRMINENGDDACVGEEGQISIELDGAIPPVGLFQEYYRDEERTIQTFSSGLYYTGDLARRDEDGYLWYEGRADDIIKTSGYRVGPFEVESALMRHPAVFECAVAGIADPEGIRGQIIKATIVLNEGYSPSDSLAKEIQDLVKSITAPYKYPRAIEFSDTLPKTFNGKIKRYVLRRQQ
ncbi:MAG: AMP-binding protein [Eubacteriaceae bacterium]|nr:AMP-binding protein [Eubacteriaceae bacterium]